MLGLALTFPAFTASLACALAYSASDYFRKDAAQRAPAVLTLFYAFLLEVPVLAAWAAFSGDFRLDEGYLAPGLLVAALGLGANFLFVIAISHSPLSLMVPLLALVPVLTALVGGATLGEWLSLQQAAGVLFVTVGLFGLFIPPEGAAHPLAVWRNLMREPGTRPMMGVVILWSLQPAVDKICLSHASVGMHGLIQLVILSGLTGGWLLMRGGPRSLSLPPGSLRPLLGVALSAGLAYGLQLVAYQMTQVAVVELIKRTIGLVGALLLGRAFFREPLSKPKIFGIGVMALGMPLVLLN